MTFKPLFGAVKTLLVILAAIGSLLASCAVASADDLLRAQILAGQSERLRMLDMAAEQEELDARESALWEQVAVVLPPREGGSNWLQEERELRKELLPYLAARQSAYRLKEKALLGDAALSSLQAEATNDATTLGSLEAVRYWSALVDNMQSSVRARLDAMHVVALARGNVKAIPEELAELLNRVAMRRHDVGAEWNRARNSWTRSDQAIERERIDRHLARAQGMVEAAMAAEQLVNDLQRRIAQVNPGPHQRLLSVIADQASRGFDRLGWKAKNLAGLGWSYPASFLEAFPGVNREDRELADLAAEHRRIVRDLLASLAGRIELINSLKRMATSREKLFADSMQQLAQNASDQGPVLDALRGEAEETWKVVDQLRTIVGRISAAIESPDRAKAAAMLGAQVEKLVFLEGMLFEIEVAKIADPFPAPDDPRLGVDAPAWQRNLQGMMASQDEWQNWRQRWDERIDEQHRGFTALRDVAERLEALRSNRLEALVADNRLTAMPGDQIDAFLAALREETRRKLADLKRRQNALSQFTKTAAEDPIIGSSVTAAGREDWSQAIRTASAMSALEERIGVLATAPTLIRAIQDHHRPSIERLESLLQLGRGLTVRWWLEGHGLELRAKTVIAGRTFVIEGLSSAAQVQLRQQDLFVQGPIRLATLVLPDMLLAQTDTDAAARGKWGLKDYVYDELADDAYVFLAMPLAGACVGGICTGGAGVIPGGLAGLAADAESAVVDVVAGAAKWDITSNTRELARAGAISEATARRREAYQVEAVSYLKAAFSLKEIASSASSKLYPQAAALYRSGFKLPTAADFHSIRALERGALDRILVRISESRESLALLERRYMHELGGATYSAWARAMDNLEQLQKLANRYQLVKDTMVVLAPITTQAGSRALARELASLIGNINDLLLGAPAERAPYSTELRQVLDSLVGRSIPGSSPGGAVVNAPPPVVTAPVTAAVPENRGRIEEHEKEKLDQLHKWQQASKPPPPKPPLLPSDDMPTKKTTDDVGTVPLDPGKDMNEYDPVKAFGDREQRRSDDVGIRNLQGFGGRNQNKFNSDDIKRDVKSNLNTLAENQREKDLKRNTGTRGDSSGGNIANRCVVDSDCPTGYKCDPQVGSCTKQLQTSGGTGAIPLCTTDRDCRSGKCVNNVCTQGPNTQSSSSAAVSTQASTAGGKKAYYLIAHEYIYQKPECKKFRWRTYDVAYVTAEEIPAFKRDLQARLPRYIGMENLTIEVRFLSGPSTTPIKAPNPEVLCLLVH